MFGLLKRYQKRLLEAQNDLIQKHCDEVENMYRQMRGWRHDYHNHIAVIQNFLESGEIDQCKEYCRQLGEDLRTVDTVLKTGNVMLDAILNSKISLAKSKRIQVNAKAAVPSTLHIADVDLCVLIGNLLDNAIEACTRVEEERMAGEHIERNVAEGKRGKSDLSEIPFLRIYIGMKGNQLYICITNTVYGRAKQADGKFISSKQSPSHGFGLMRIDKICQKYDGYIHRGSEEGAFSTEILLPVG